MEAQRYADGLDYAVWAHDGQVEVLGERLHATLRTVVQLAWHSATIRRVPANCCRACFPKWSGSVACATRKVIRRLVVRQLRTSVIA
jgi:hypothetical protein